MPRFFVPGLKVVSEANFGFVHQRWTLRSINREYCYLRLAYIIQGSNVTLHFGLLEIPFRTYIRQLQLYITFTFIRSDVLLNQRSQATLNIR